MFPALLAALATGADQGSPEASPSKPEVITNPSWASRPSGANLASVLPPKAVKGGVSGGATLSCTVNVKGYLEACSVTSEYPAGYGFGAAVLRLVPYFRMHPRTRNGVAEGGATVSVPIRWMISGGGPQIGDQFYFVPRPIWAAAPDSADVAKAYPKSANGAPIRMIIRCSIQKDGALFDCQPRTIEPEDYRYASVMEALTPKFRLRMDPGVRRVLQLKVDFPIRVSDPAKREPSEPMTPMWTESPSPADLAAAFPAGAAARGFKRGKAVVSCTVAVGGALTSCQAVSADPAGLGFGEAAVKIAQAMRMNPWTDEGGPVDGAKVNVPVEFTRSAP